MAAVFLHFINGALAGVVPANASRLTSLGLRCKHVCPGDRNTDEETQVGGTAMKLQRSDPMQWD